MMVCLEGSVDMLPPPLPKIVMHFGHQKCHGGGGGGGRLHDGIRVSSSQIVAMGGSTYINTDKQLNTVSTPGADLGLLQWWGCSSNAREKFWATPT